MPAQLGKPQILLPISGASSTVGDHGEIIQAEDPIEEKSRFQQADRLRQQQSIEAERLQQESEQQRQAQLNQEGVEQQQQSPDSPGIYTRLENLLKAKKWKEADELTKRIVLMNNQDNLLTAPQIRQIPLDLLNSVDRLWMEYSDGRFGLRVQWQLWQKSLEPKILPFDLRKPFAVRVEPVTESQAWNGFGCLVGWRSNDEKLLLDTKLDFSMKASPGCFPRTRLWLHGGYGNTIKQFVILMERVAQLE